MATVNLVKYMDEIKDSVISTGETVVFQVEYKNKKFIVEMSSVIDMEHTYEKFEKGSIFAGDSMQYLIHHIMKKYKTAVMIDGGYCFYNNDILVTVYPEIYETLERGRFH